MKNSVVNKFLVLITLTLIPVMQLLAGTTINKEEAKYEKLVRDNSGDPVQIKVFLKGLKKAVAENNKLHVLQYLQYPMQLKDNCRNTQIKSPKEMLPFYDRVFTDRVKEAILKADLRDVIYRMGFSILGGEIWFDKYDENKSVNGSHYYIYTINSHDLWASVIRSDREEYLEAPADIFTTWKIEEQRNARDRSIPVKGASKSAIGNLLEIEHKYLSNRSSNDVFDFGKMKYDDAFVRYSVVIEGNMYEPAPFDYDYVHWDEKGKDGYDLSCAATSELVFCSKGKQMAVFYIDRNKDLIFVKGESLYVLKKPSVKKH